MRGERKKPPYRHATTKYLTAVPVRMNSIKAATPSGKRHQSLSCASADTKSSQRK